jgi:hypothetical protein
MPPISLADRLLFGAGRRYVTRYNFRNHPYTRDIKMEKAEAKRNRRAQRNIELMERANAKSN